MSRAELRLALITLETKLALVRQPKSLSARLVTYSQRNVWLVRAAALSYYHRPSRRSAQRHKTPLLCAIKAAKCMVIAPPPPPPSMHSAHCSARPRQCCFYYVKPIRVTYQTMPSCGTSSLCARGKKKRKQNVASE